MRQRGGAFLLVAVLAAGLCLVAAAAWAQAEPSAEVAKAIAALRGGQRNIDAVRDLMGLGAAAEPAIPELIQALGASNDPQIGDYAREALHRIGEPAVPALDKAMQGNDRYLQLRAAETLRKIGGPAAESALVDALPVLVTALLDEDSGIRERAVPILVGFGSTAVPDLLPFLQGGDEAGAAAAHALELMGAEAASAVPDLVTALAQKGADDNLDRAAAATALGAIGDAQIQASPGAAPAPEIVVALTQALADENPFVVIAAAGSLGGLGSHGAPAIERLTDLLKDTRSGSGRADLVCDSAAWALGRMGTAAVTALPALVATERGGCPGQSSVREAVKAISEAVQSEAPQWSVEALAARMAIVKQAAAGLGELDNGNELDIARALQMLELIYNEKKSSLGRQLVAWAAQNQALAGLVAYLAVASLLCFGLLWLRPRWILSVNDFVERYADVQLPAWLGGIKVPMSTALLVGFFRYHPRVLDAWVQAHAGPARERFALKTSVRDRQVHIAMPVVLDGRGVALLGPADLRPAFARRVACLLVYGEGGSGKTSLACQVARWAMAEEPEQRLCRHVALPVLIESELDGAGDATKDPLTAAIARQLQDLIESQEAIPAPLLDRLLRRQRVLVIVDRLSELSDAARSRIKPAAAGFAANALIVTSRLDEGLGEVTKSVLKPLRIAGNRLSSFMEAYLTHLGKRELFDDRAFFEACGRLSTIVGERDVTVLFAKLYAEQIVRLKEGSADGEVPDSIPDLMLSYLNQLNQGVAGEKLEDRAVQHDAKTVAWECLKASFRPGAADLDAVIAALGGDTAPTRLRYLEDRLRLIRTLEPAKDQVRFLLDPLAEYLAALHLAEACAGDEAAWDDVLAHADAVPGAPQTIRGFLLALRDCCLAKGSRLHTPDAVATALAERLAPAPAAVAAPVVPAPETGAAAAPISAIPVSEPA